MLRISMKKLRIHLENSFLILVRLLESDLKIYLLKKNFFLLFFPIPNFTQISAVNFWTQVARKFISSLLNKFYKQPLIFVGLKFSLALIFVTCEKIRRLGPNFFLADKVCLVLEIIISKQPPVLYN